MRNCLSNINHPFIYLGAMVLMFSSCLRLDANLYGYEKVEEYKFEEYEGEQEIYLDENYAIQDSMIHLFTMASTIDGEDPVDIYAVYIGDQNKISTDTVIMYFHGTADHMDFYWNRAKLLAHLGGKHNYGVLMIDYRGYGLSEGDPSEEGMYADGKAALDWLKENGLSKERCIIYGFSLGTAPATELTSKPRSLEPNKLVLEAPFASSDVMTSDGSGLNMPSSYFVNFKIDVAEDIKNINQPFLWIHGKDDNFLDYETHGKVVYKNYKGSYSESVEVDGGKHGDVPEVYGFNKYLDVITEFIRK